MPRDFQDLISIWGNDVYVNSNNKTDDQFRRRRKLIPEQRLMLAILEDAVGVFQKYVLAERRSSNRKNPAQQKADYFREAEEWILDIEEEGLHSFHNICDTLGLNSDYIRKGLMRWKEEALRGGNVKALPSRSYRIEKTRFEPGVKEK